MKMPVTEFKEENLPKGLRKKKIKEIKYRRKYGKMATIPVVTLFLLASLTVSGSFVLCNRHTVTFSHTNANSILVNGTSMNTDVWILSNGNESLHYNWDGSTNSASDFNFTTAPTVGGLTGACWNQTKTSMIFSKGWDELYEYDKDGTNVANHSISGIPDTITGITQYGGYLYTVHQAGNMTKWNPDYSLNFTCVIPNFTGSYPAGITTNDGIVFWIDNEYYGSQTIVMYENCTKIATYNLSQTGDHPMGHGIDTTDGEHFWYIDYDTGGIVRVANDSTPPQIRNAGNNLTYMTRNGTLAIWGQVYDSCNCNWSWIRSNETGSLVDVTGSAGNHSIDYNNAVYNISMNWSNNSHYCNQKLGLYVCAGDGAGNTNCSDVMNIYRLPYAYNTSGAAISSATCTSEYDATFTFGATGVMNHTFYFERVYRNATHSECNYDTSIGGRIEITNMTTSGMHLCVINVTPDIVTAGGTVRVHEAPPLKGAALPNLPAALAGLVATLMIFIYSYTTRR